jgi:hypothetical protein
MHLQSGWGGAPEYWHLFEDATPFTDSDVGDGGGGRQLGNETDAQLRVRSKERQRARTRHENHARLGTPRSLAGDVYILSTFLTSIMLSTDMNAPFSSPADAYQPTWDHSTGHAILNPPVVENMGIDVSH